MLKYESKCYFPQYIFVIHLTNKNVYCTPFNYEFRSIKKLLKLLSSHVYSISREKQEISYFVLPAVKGPAFCKKPIITLKWMFLSTMRESTWKVEMPQSLAIQLNWNLFFCIQEKHFHKRTRVATKGSKGAFFIPMKSFEKRPNSCVKISRLMAFQFHIFFSLYSIYWVIKFSEQFYLKKCK